jgi:LuxR family glucitol operon transcriptional activator
MIQHNLSRQTLFVLISAIEKDLRNAIRLYLPGLPIKQIFPSETLDKILGRYSEQEKTSTEEASEQSIEDLLVYSDFGDPIEAINRNRSALPKEIGDYFKKTSPQLQKLIPIRNRVMHQRPLEMADLPTLTGLSESLVKEESLWKELNAVCAKLKKEPSFVISERIPIIEQSKQNHNLPLPDFDETGLIGRDEQIKQLSGWITKGSHPVITIVGEGGLGKTSLAIKTAYQILDMENCPFEAVIWATCKTTKLTSLGITEIRDAIYTSLGLLNSAATYLSGNLDELLQYMEAYPILLILDNLETVLNDNNIREFLDKLMGNKSKILITSRIGLGAYERPMKLAPLTESQSIQLLRILSTTRHIKHLSYVPNNELENYCRQMKNNPGWIKWFVAACEGGKRPEEILAHPETFLDYCMSNVYEYLSLTSRQILKSMLCLSGRTSQAEILFFNEQISTLELEKALLELQNTNIVIISSKSQGSYYESSYELSELTRDYLNRHHPLSKDEMQHFIKRKNQMVSTKENFRSGQKNDPYSIYSIHTVTGSNILVANDLLQALKACRDKDFQRATEYINKALSVAPQFFEVRKTEAWIKDRQGDILAAKLAYEAAIELESKSAPLRFFYGGFLLRKFDDPEKALVEFVEAIKLDPEEPRILLEIARANLYLKEYEKSREILTPLINKLSSYAYETSLQRKILQLNLDFHHRLAEYFLDQQHDTINSISNLEKFKQSFDTIPQKLLDGRMRETVTKTIRTLKSCLYYSEENNKDKVNALIRWAESQNVNDIDNISVPLKI